jgi:hypothetical protein
MRHYDNTYKDFAYYYFTYNIYKFDISCMFLFTFMSKIHLQVESVISNVIIKNVTLIKCFKYCHYR